MLTTKNKIVIKLIYYKINVPVMDHVLIVGYLKRNLKYIYEKNSKKSDWLTSLNNYFL